MAQITGGQLVAKSLKSEGIDTIFTLCGGHIMDIYNGCIDENIRIIDVRHEQTAAHAADAWTRITGTPGAAVVTAGPGVTDAVTGVANAARAQVPMLLIGGQAPLKDRFKGALQELDSTEIFKSITKFSETVMHTQTIPEMIRFALGEACNGRPGPAFLAIPMDTLERAVNEDEVKFPVLPRPKIRIKADDRLIDQAVELVSNAQRPALLAGSQVWHCRAADRLLTFLTKTKIPCYLNGSARGCIPQTSGFLMNRSRKKALSTADLVIVLGTPFDFRLGFGRSISPDARVIQVDLDYSELSRNREVEVPINGDIAEVLGQFNDAMPAINENRPWIKELRAAEERLAEIDMQFMNSDRVPIHPLRLAREINSFLGEETIFIADGGDVVTMAASVITPHRPGSWLDPGPFGTLGVGAPFAIGAKAAKPQAEIVVLFGDGAFGLTGFDYDTLIRFNMPVVGVVANNAAWNQIRYVQYERYGAERGDVANLLSPLRYDKLVEAMGGYGEHVTEPHEIRPALERARDSGKPSCINVVVDREVFSASTRNKTLYK